MKKLTVCLLLAAALLSCAFAEEEADPFDVDLSGIGLTMPDSGLSKDFEQEGAEGAVRFAEDAGSAGDRTEEPETVADGYAPEGVSRMIIGKDDRVAVDNPRTYPYSTMADMKVTGECGCKWECTGFMVGKRFMLTAAHCMICQEHDKWAKNVTFYFGHQSDTKYAYKYTGSWTAVAGTTFPDGYRYDAMENDWCYVKLEEDVGEKTGWLGMNIASDSEIRSRYYTVAGYRDDELKYAFGWAAAYSANLMLFDADEEGGNSGGPIFLFHEDRVDGIIVAELPDVELNIGHRITKTMWECMKNDGYQ